jgi:hypothetical protein
VALAAEASAAVFPRVVMCTETRMGCLVWPLGSMSNICMWRWESEGWVVGGRDGSKMVRSCNLGGCPRLFRSVCEKAAGGFLVVIVVGGW